MSTKKLKFVKKFALATTLAAGLSLVGVANAGYIATLDQNDCSGVFGQPFGACAIPATYDPNQSPVIAKFDADTGGWEINTALFPHVTASDFTIDNTAGNGTGTWSYTPDANGPGTADDDPWVTFFVAKGGSNFNLFGNGVGAPPNQTGPYAVSNVAWFTPTNPNNGKNFGLSHITFYDHGDGGGPPQQIPEPGSMLLIGAALAGLGLMRRRRVA